MAQFFQSRREILAGVAGLSLSGSAEAAASPEADSASPGTSPANGPSMAPTFVQSGQGAVATTIEEKLRHAADVSVFDFMTRMQIDDVRSYRFGSDVTAACQSALDAAWSSGRNCYFPAGGYRVTTLSIPGNSRFRTRALKIHGQGSGEIFARDFTGGTILYGAADAPVLRYVQDVQNTGGGTLEVCGFRFEGNSSGYVVDLEALYSLSSFHDNAIYQGGNGGGFRCGLMATVEVYHNYAINRDWNRERVGAARTGIGFEITQDINCGLAMLRKNTSRGWHTAYKLGDGTTSPISCKFEHNECSLVYDGIVIAPAAQKTIVCSNYFEGGDGGTGIRNEGNYTTISDNLIFPGFRSLVDDSSDQTVGTVITGNVLSAGDFPETRLVQVCSSGAQGGPTKVVSGNSFAFSGFGGSVPGVVGLSITGIDPRLDISGNYFMPRGVWTGGPGTTKISDQSTSSRGPRGLARGQFGIGIVANGDQEFTALNQGMISLGVPASALDERAASGGALDTGDGSWFELAPERAVRITHFAPGGQEGRLVKVHATNGNATFVAGPGLKLAGSANYTPGANGAVLTFLVSGAHGGLPVAIECAGRVEF